MKRAKLAGLRRNAVVVLNNERRRHYGSTWWPFAVCRAFRTVVRSAYEVARCHHAVETASTMGIDLLREEQSRALQLRGECDRKTSSWVQTPSSIRARGGAFRCDRRYDTVFVYHNGADSYQASRVFRETIRV